MNEQRPSNQELIDSLEAADPHDTPTLCKDLLREAANEIERLSHYKRRVAELELIIKGKTFVTDEPPAVQAKIAARDVHYRLIEEFGLANDPSANDVVRRLLEGLAMSTAEPPPAALPKPINHDLWRHLHDEHGLTLLQSELDEILSFAQPPRTCLCDQSLSLLRRMRDEYMARSDLSGRITREADALIERLRNRASQPPGDALTLLRGIVDNCQTVPTPSIGSRMDPVNSLYLVSARRVEAAREYLSTAETKESSRIGAGIPPDGAPSMPANENSAPCCDINASYPGKHREGCMAAEPALPHLDTCALKNGGNRCSCGLSGETRGGHG